MAEDVAGPSRYDAVPSALIFADSDAGGVAASDAVRAAGGRVVARLGLDEAAGRLNQQAAIGAVVVDLSADHGSLADALLDRLGHMAVCEGRPTIVTAPLALIGSVAARLSEGSVTLLCEPDPAERISALTLAWSGQALPGVADISTEVDSAHLRRLADEASRIARALSALSVGKLTDTGLPRSLRTQVADVHLGFAAEPLDVAAIDMPAAEEIRSILRLRRLRDSFFESSLFADPAWDMLLDLLAARIEGDQVAVSSLCIAAAVPPTTALRWIKTMTDNGLFEREADPTDGRRIYIRLSDAAAHGMARYFAAAKRADAMIA